MLISPEAIGQTRRRLFLFAITLFAVSWSALCHAQLSTQATINGTVTDASGAFVPDAQIVIRNISTNVVVETKTNKDGVYVANNLNVATYSITVSKSGFQKYTVNNVELHPATSTAVNAALAVGAETSEVTVQAASSEVETSSSELSTSLSGNQVATLPMNGRNFSSLVGLLPGAVNTNQGTALGTGGRSTTNAVSINGLATSTSFYALDGIWNENTGNMNQQSVIPNPDSLQEVRVLQNNFSAQYSLMGANVILLQTKSGTAKWHGTAWEFLRNDDLNTKPYFSTSIPSYKQNIFGYNISGPVYIPHFYNANKQKTFFFWSEQFVILHVPSQTTSILPTPLQKAGCFSSPIKDPVSGINFAAATTGVCAGLYQIPSNRINVSSQAYLNALYPTPNYTTATNATNYINLKPNITDQRDDQIKIDHNFNDRYHLLGEYLDEYQSFAQNLLSPGTTPVSSETDFTHNKLAQISLTQTLTPSMVNTTSVAMNIFLLNLSLQGTTDISQIPNFNENFFYPTAKYATRTPVVSLSGLAGQGVSASRPLPHAGDLDFTVNDNWSWLRGKHYMLAGINFIYNTKRQDSGQQTNGNLSFNGSFTKPATGSVQGDDSVADMLLGYVGGFSQTSNEPHGVVKAFSWSPYVEDQYKATKNLTLTLGLRVYHMPLPAGPANSETNWVVGMDLNNYYNNPYYDPSNAPTVNQTTGVTSILPGTTYSNGLLFNSGASGGLPVNFSNRHTWYFAPDAGFALDVFGNGKTSLRGGFGVSYFRYFSNQDCSFNCIANPPVLTSQNLSNLQFPSTNTWDITAAGGSANPVGVQTVTAMDYNIQATPTDSYSLGLQHELLPSLTFSLVGAGTRVQHLESTWNANQPPHVTVGGVAYEFNPLINSNPANKSAAGDSSYYYEPYKGYNAISTMFSRLWQEWNGLETSVKYTKPKTVSITEAYTWSHATGNIVTDPYNIGKYHGNSAGYNFAHNGSITIIYHLPFFQHSRSFVAEALGGWQVNDISTFRGGTSLSAALSVSNQGLAAYPDAVPGASTAGPKTWKTGSTKQWFNTAAFIRPAYGFYGNVQPGTIKGPGQQIHNVSLFKEFNFKETGLFEFRAEAFNVFNHTNPGNPGTTLGTSTFGVITGASDPRILELAVRVKF